MTEARTHLINAPVGAAWHYFRIADDTETISLWLNAHVLSTADSAFNRLLSDLNRLL
jgi:hypothetical protein